MKSPIPNPISRLEDLPNVGPRIAKDLQAIGIATPAQLRKRAPLAVFHELKTPMGRRHDPCVFYTLLAVKHFFDSAESLPWWSFSKQGKAALSKQATHSKS